MVVNLIKLMKITKRDIKFFVLGLFTMIIVDIISDWEGSVQSFKDGYNAGRSPNKEIKP